MKKLFLSLSVASAMGLSGCGGGESIDDIANNVEPVVPAARVVFDPAAGAVSVPNDLLFNGTMDGTLEMPGEAAARAAGQTPDYSDPQTALGVLDGWSTQNPFVINLSFPTGLGLDADSAAAPGAVRIFEVVMGGDLTDPECAVVPRGIACKPVGELTYGVDFINSASGNNVAVAPLKPLKPATTYIVSLTSVLKDSSGRSIEPSASYNLLRQNLQTDPLGSDTQKALQAVFNSFEGVIGAAGANIGETIYTAAMTTQSVNNVLMNVKSLLASSIQTAPPVVAAAPTGATVADALMAAGRLDPTNPAFPSFQAALLYTGSINAPYYLATPSAENPMAPVNTSWKAACDSAAIISAYAAQTGDAWPYDLSSTTPVSQNDGFCLLASGGQLRDLGLDAERHLTKFNSLPKQNSMQTLDVQMTVPEINTVNAIRAQLGMPALEKPASGWPVVMLVHGITSQKEDMLATTGSLTLGGFATVAIDLPLHGSRGFDLNQDGTDEISATTVSPTHYMNLANLPTTRDNLRQSVSDMLALRLGLNFAQGADLDASQVYTLGLSLGAITSASFAGITNTTNLEASTGVPGIDSLFHVNAVTLASPGGGIANFLVESPAFGPLIQGSLLSVAGTPLSDEFNAFLQTPADACLPFVSNQNAYLGCQAQVFLGQLTANGETAKLAEFQSIISGFTFAAQTVTDSGDPSNYASMVTANGTPVLLTEIIGDGAENLSDQVIPNQSQATPIGGTEPLIRALGLQGVSATTQGELVDGVPSKVSGAVRFTKGHHASVIDPSTREGAMDEEANGRVTAEMQSQALGFFSTRGTVIPVTDGEFVAGSNQ